MNLTAVLFSFLLAVMSTSLTACKTNFDISPEAYASSDFTLISALSDGPCKAIPAGGADVCRFKDGAQVESVWRMVIPQTSGILAAKVTGQVTVYFRDFSKVYPVDGQTVLEVPFSDLVGPTWEKSDGGVATALAELKYTSSDGVERVMLAEGMAVMIVLSKDYDPLPLDSGNQNWSMACRVDYTTAGRSALECK